MATINWESDQAALKKQLLSLSKSKLIKLCKERNIASTGNKNDMISRLIMYKGSANNKPNKKSKSKSKSSAKSLSRPKPTISTYRSIVSGYIRQSQYNICQDIIDLCFTYYALYEYWAIVSDGFDTTQEGLMLNRLKQDDNTRNTSYGNIIIPSRYNTSYGKLIIPSIGNLIYKWWFTFTSLTLSIGICDSKYVETSKNRPKMSWNDVRCYYWDVAAGYLYSTKGGVTSTIYDTIDPQEEKIMIEWDTRENKGRVVFNRIMPNIYGFAAWGEEPTKEWTREIKSHKIKQGKNLSYRLCIYLQKQGDSVCLVDFVTE